MFSFSGKKRRSTKLCRDLVNFFHGQKTFISDFWLEDKDGHPNGAALGYMFGFVDCALRAAALDIRDTHGRAMMLALLNEFAPGRAGRYYDFFGESERAHVGYNWHRARRKRAPRLD